RNVAEASAAVRAHDEASARLVKRVFVLRVHRQVGEVEGTPDHISAAVERGPGGAAVVGAVQAVLGRLRLDEGVNDLGIRRLYREGRTAPRFGGEPRGGLLVEFRPVR